GGLPASVSPLPGGFPHPHGLGGHPRWVGLEGRRLDEAHGAVLLAPARGGAGLLGWVWGLAEAPGKSTVGAWGGGTPAFGRGRVRPAASPVTTEPLPRTGPALPPPPVSGGPAAPALPWTGPPPPRSGWRPAGPFPEPGPRRSHLPCNPHSRSGSQPSPRAASDDIVRRLTGRKEVYPR